MNRNHTNVIKHADASGQRVDGRRNLIRRTIAGKWIAGLLTVALLVGFTTDVGAAEAVAKPEKPDVEPKAPAGAKSPAENSLENKFLQALIDEETNPNLDVAVRAYEEVIARVDTQRKMAATALFRLGECYRKQGKTNEARVQFERVARDFSDQATLVETAQRRARELAPDKAAAEGIMAGSPTEAKKIDPERVKSIREEIKLVETQLELARKKVNSGIDAFGELEKFQQDLFVLMRQLPENSALEQQKKLIVEQLKLVEKRMEAMRRRINSGNAATADSIPIERELLALKRDLAAIPTATPSTTGTKEAPAATEEEAREVQRIKALIKDSPDLINAKVDNGNTPLHLAAGKGQVVVAQFLLNNQAQVDSRDNIQDTPLITATRGGHKSMVELLLNHQANPNAANGKGETPLFVAASKGYKAVAEALLIKGAAVNPKGASYVTKYDDVTGFTPLHAAVYHGYRTMVELLLSKNADVNANSTRSPRSNTSFSDPVNGTPLHYAVANGNEELATILMSHGCAVEIRNDYGFTPLLLAAKLVHTDIVKQLIAHRAEVNSSIPENREPSGYTALHYATLSKNRPLAELLLNQGAKVNAREKRGITPLALTMIFDSAEEMVKLLLDHGADVNAQDNQDRETPVYRAIEANSPTNLTLLLAHKPDLEAKTANNLTVLQKAVLNKNPRAVELLLNAGADPNVTWHADGDTPLHWATRTPHKEIIKLLLDHKANVNAQNKAGVTPLNLALAQNPGGNSPASRPRGFPPGVPTSRPVSGVPGLPPPIMPVPAFPSRVSGVPNLDADQTKPINEIEALLRQYGANENLERLSRVSLSQPSRNLLAPVFYKGTNDFNRHTLLELIAQGAAAFPDLTNVTIHRLSENGATNDLKIDLAAVLESGDRTKDPWLTWGDVVEIPEMDHLVTDKWTGLPQHTLKMLVDGLRRSVQFKIKGQTIQRELVPSLFHAYPQSEIERKTILSCWLYNVVRSANVLLTSSDTTRVRVKRVDPVTKQPLDMVFDLEKTDPNTDLWLRDGDVIEIPEKGE